MDENIYYIDEPERLIALAKDWQKQREQQPNGTKITIRLSLLQPLANSDILAACRNPSSRYMRDEAGNRLNSITNYEYLDLSALSTLWRKACMQIPPAAVKEVCFDMSLPRKSDGEDGEEGQGQIIHWDASMPSGGGIAVQSQECGSLIVLLATTLKVREGGSGIRFSLSSAEGQSERMYAMAKLNGTLERLSEYAGGASRAV